MFKAFRPVARTVFNLGREASLYARMENPGTRLAVLPWSAPETSSLLRGYKIAEALNARDWNALVLPQEISLRQRQRVLRRFRPDLALLLKSRHPLNSAALLNGIPYIYDLDDADFHDPVILPRVEEDVAQAVGVIAGSCYIERWCRARNPNTTVIWTGTPSVPGDYPPHAERPRVVAWAQSYAFKYKAELDFVVSLMTSLGDQGLILRLYGCGPEHETAPEVRQLRAAGVGVDLRPFMAYEDFLASLNDVAVGLCPFITTSPFSRGKSFGKVLAYLGAGVPIIASDAADHALFFRPETGVVSNDPDIWRTEILALMDSPTRRDDMARSAFADFEARLSTHAAADRVEAFARAVLEGKTHPDAKISA